MTHIFGFGNRDLNIHTVIKISVSAPVIIESMPDVGQQPQPSHKSTPKQNVRTKNAPTNITGKVLKIKTLKSLKKVMNR